MTIHDRTRLTDLLFLLKLWEKCYIMSVSAKKLEGSVITMLARILLVGIILASVIVAFCAYALVKVAGDADDYLEKIQTKDESGVVI